jgi:SAM-dependent methyltransferase
VPPPTSQPAPAKPISHLRGLTGAPTHPFDAQHGVRTSGLIPGRQLQTGHTHDRHSTAYFGVAPSVFHSLMKRWQRAIKPLKLNDFTFIDYGAGMGRALLLASELPFKRVTGVELHPSLTRIARANLRAWKAAGRARASVRLIHGDALDLELPESPVLAFLFNPFAATVLRRLMRRLACHPALDLLYVNHEQEHVIEANKRFTRIWRGRIRRVAIDEKADRLTMARQPEPEYAVDAWEDCSFWRIRKP